MKRFILLLTLLIAAPSFATTSVIFGSNIVYGTDGIAEQLPEWAYSNAVLWATFSRNESNAPSFWVGQQLAPPSAAQTPVFGTNYGGSVVFDGVNDELYIGNSGWLTNAPIQSVFAWIIVATNSTTYALASSDEAPGNVYAWYMRISAGLQMQVGVISNTAYSMSAISAGPHLIGWGWNGSSNQFWIDGLSVGLTNAVAGQSGGINGIQSRDNITVGSVHRNTVTYQPGTIFEVIALTNVPTTAQVSNDLFRAMSQRYGLQ